VLLRKLTANILSASPILHCSSVFLTQNLKNNNNKVIKNEINDCFLSIEREENYFFINAECLLTRLPYIKCREYLLDRLPHLKCIRLGSVRLSHFPIKIH